jgi:CRP/FNR family transcriptional regulator
VGGSVLAERLAHFIALTDAERRALDRLGQQERKYRRGQVVRQEHDPARELFVVHSGWLYSSILLGNGSRQIMRFHFPGDLLGTSALAFDRAAEAIGAATDVTLGVFEKERLSDLFTEHPRLAALILALNVAERVDLAERLASIGRTSARERVALLLCKTFARLREVEGKELNELHIPLTQEAIGDATGLTAVHVNRMMRGLVDDQIIERSGSVVRLLNETRLAEEANFVKRFPALDMSWLPKPR